MTAPEIQTTPVKVVTGCLGCSHFQDDKEYGWRCYHAMHRHRGHLGIRPPRVITIDSRPNSDTPPDWCPLPKLGDTVEVRQA